MKAERIYTSSYGASDRVTAAQRIAEIVCERMAKSRGKSLPDRFWNQDEWKGPFLTQVRLANALLRVSSPEAVFRALRANDWVFSLANKKLEASVLAEQKAVDASLARAEAAPEPTPQPPPAPPRAVRSGGNAGGLRSRLKGL